VAKGIVRIVFSPYVVPNLYDSHRLLVWNTKEDILKNVCVTVSIVQVSGVQNNMKIQDNFKQFSFLSEQSFNPEGRPTHLDSSACICKAMVVDCEISVTSEMIGPPVITLLVEQDALSVDGW